jgi:hypothetical protein
MAQDQLAASHRLGRNVLGRNFLDAMPVAIGLAFLAPEQTPRLGDRKRLGDMEAVLVMARSTRGPRHRRMLPQEY